MSTRLYVGNLPFNTTENDLQDLFSQHGAVTGTEIIMDKMTSRSRGFGFVTMEAAEDAKKAVESLHGKSFEGRNLVVNEARPREERSTRSFSGGGGDRGNNRRRHNS